VIVIRHVGSDDPEMIVADPEYSMIRVVTYKAEHEHGRTGLVIEIRFDNFAGPDRREEVVSGDVAYQYILTRA
jgi:hypothetical protein